VIGDDHRRRLLSRTPADRSQDAATKLLGSPTRSGKNKSVLATHLMALTEPARVTTRVSCFIRNNVPLFHAWSTRSDTPSALTSQLSKGSLGNRSCRANLDPNLAVEDKYQGYQRFLTLDGESITGVIRSESRNRELSCKCKKGKLRRHLPR